MALIFGTGKVICLVRDAGLMSEGLSDVDPRTPLLVTPIHPTRLKWPRSRRNCTRRLAAITQSISCLPAPSLRGVALF